eukprot:91611-Rhodomonas_salina.2
MLSFGSCVRVLMWYVGGAAAVLLRRGPHPGLCTHEEPVSARFSPCPSPLALSVLLFSPPPPLPQVQGLLPDSARPPHVNAIYRERTNRACARERTGGRSKRESVR